MIIFTLVIVDMVVRCQVRTTRKTDERTVQILPFAPAESHTRNNVTIDVRSNVVQVVRSAYGQ